MRDDEGYIILHNGVRRTFRDKRETAFEAARYAKSKAKGELIEIVDCATGAKLIMLEGWADGLDPDHHTISRRAGIAETPIKPPLWKP